MNHFKPRIVTPLIAFTFVIGMSSPVTVEAGVIATEGFQDYTGATPQDLNGKNGGVDWTSAWSIAGGANTAQVLAPGDNPAGSNTAPAGGLTYSNGSISRDGGDRMGWFGPDMTSFPDGMERSFSATSADTVYLSMLWQPDNKSGYRFGLADSDKDILGVEFNSGGLSARVREADGIPSQFGTGVSSVSQSTHLLVIKFEKSTSGAANPYTDVSFFLDPDSDTEPTTADGSQSISGFDSAPTSLDRVYFTEDADSGTDVFTDQLRVTTTFGEAVVIPEPASAALLALSGAVMLLPRRRRA